MENHSFEVLIVGGGLAGLTTALHLSENGIDVGLIEKKEFPRHKVCGEYVSNEVLPYLNSLHVDPIAAGAKRIEKFELTDIHGKPIQIELPLGGFGISRYGFDNLFFGKLKEKIPIEIDTVLRIKKNGEKFEVETKSGKFFYAFYVVGAHGKRSNLDTFLNRKFILKKSPWMAVKCHYEFDFPEDTVALHNFPGGYCGLSKTETDVVNACYLATFKSFQKTKNISDFQYQVLSQNPELKHFFKHAKPVFKKPIAISQISFDKKKAVENHIFMVGDSAGLIHPLCGNGMAMAIMAAKLFSETFISCRNSNHSREVLENEYINLWNAAFLSRLKTGNLIQKALMNPMVSKIGFSVGKTFPSLISKLITHTHGKME